MKLADKLQLWWDRVRGYEPPAVATPRTPRAPQGEHAAEAARPLAEVQDEGSGEPLKLSVEGPPSQTGRPPRRRYGEAGFNPYSSTAGFGKRRNWDDVPRK